MVQILLHAVLPSSCTENYASEYKIAYKRKIELYDSGYGLWTMDWHYAIVSSIKFHSNVNFHTKFHSLQNCIANDSFIQWIL